MVEISRQQTAPLVRSHENRMSVNNNNLRQMETMPLVQARVLIFTDLIHLIETELQKCSSIEWEERIFLHAVVKEQIGLEKDLPNMSFTEHI